MGTNFDAQEQKRLVGVPMIDSASRFPLAYHGSSRKNSGRHCIRLTTSF
jgi:hypothetical protein